MTCSFTKNVNTNLLLDDNILYKQQCFIGMDSNTGNPIMFSKEDKIRSKDILCSFQKI